MSTLIVYPDANPESTSVDGSIDISSQATFADARNATTGGSFSDSATTIYIGVGRGGGGGYSLNRAILLFDTSTLGSGITVTGATLSLWIDSTNDSVNDGNDYASIVASNPASNTGLSTADFDAFTGTDDANPLTSGVAMKEMHDSGERKDFTGMATGAYLDWTLNSTGIAAINKTGITKFGVACGNDVTNTNYTGGLSTDNGMTFQSAENASRTAHAPKLTITYTTSSALSNKLALLGVG